MKYQHNKYQHSIIKSFIANHWIIIVLLSLTCFSCSKNKVPTGLQNKQAEELYQKVRDTSGYDFWNKEVSAVHYRWHAQIISKRLSIVRDIFWDKKRGLVEVSWKKIKVQFNKKNRNNTIVFVNDVIITDIKEIKKLTEEAYSFFINDTFWLNPLFTINTPDSNKLYLSDHELLVTFNQGGVTPGDSYLFSLDEAYKVKSMRMWVSTIPIKGIKVIFKDYITLEDKIPFSTTRSISVLGKVITLEKIKLYKTYPEPRDGNEKFINDRFSLLVPEEVTVIKE